MYVHIGRDYMIPARAIVAVFDMDTATASRRTSGLLARLEGEGRVVDLGGGLPRAGVLCADGMGEMLYLSPISSKTLKARSRA